ncbi:MAG TPA: acetamidase/formamidase family protein [Edaphobacter sp.]|jgi:acetamidase/formamidase|nr:acetamidase/formamidase family protein [Edaphobacter sp.]
MTRTKLALYLLAPCLLVIAPIAVTAQTPTATGNWLVSANYFGTPMYVRLNLQQNGDKLTGTYRGFKLEGTIHGDAFHLSATDEQGNTDELTGTITNGTLQATDTETDADNKANPVTLKITATLAPALTHPTPQRHEFTPTVFYRQFSAFNKPVLTINPGDTIHTTTVDAGGNDLNGVKRSLGGNPETGPFYITGAMPGDVLVVHINKLTLNRDWAGSDDGLDERAMDSDLAVKMKDVGKGIRWHLDRTAGTATPDKPAEHLKHYTIPLRPMLGCIAAAPGIAQAAPGTGDSGGYGGNMDFNEVTEGATVYLRVSNPGALLYFGDGHAAQGDGELNGNALETSMDVDLTVDIIPNKRIGGPRIENPTSIIAMGLAGSLDDAFKAATSDMATWLAEDYKLTPSEIAQVLGTAAEYHVSEVADRNAGVILKINKARLATLTK